MGEDLTITGGSSMCAKGASMIFNAPPQFGQFRCRYRSRLSSLAQLMRADVPCA